MKVLALSLILFSSVSFSQVTGEGVDETPSLIVSGLDFEDMTKCWAKIYDGQDFNGRSITLVGYTAWPNLNMPGWPNWEGQIDSVVVGPGAVLTLYGLPMFADEDQTITGGISVRNLVDVPLGDAVESLRLTCNPQ